MNDLPVPKAVCLSLLGLLAASSPRRASLDPFPLPHFLAGAWLQNAKGEHPLEPAQGFTLPWVDRSLAQCGSMRRHAPISTIHLPMGDARLDMYCRATKSNSRCARRGEGPVGMEVGLVGTTESEGDNVPVHCTPAVHPGDMARRVRPQYSLTTACARDDTEAMPVERRRRAHNLMNSTGMDTHIKVREYVKSAEDVKQVSRVRMSGTTVE